MKIIHESVFMSALRAFFNVLCGVLGALVALFIVAIIFFGIFSSAEDKFFSSDVKILPDAEGNREKLSAKTPIILQITIEGEIGKEKLTGKHIEELLLDSREDAFEKNRVKGILLHINSPGGGVVDSDIIYRHLQNYKKRYNVPIYAFIDGLCASGGYYIACASDQIFASNVSLIGSIGVLSWPPFMNVTDAMEKIGVDALTLSAGKGKDEMNPFRPWKEGEEAHRQRLLDYYYEQFVTLVSQNRPIDKQDLEKTLGANVFPAPIAQQFKLIDFSNSTRSKALVALVEKAGIDGAYQVVGFETSSWWKKAFQERRKIKHELSMPQFDVNAFFYK